MHLYGRGRLDSESKILDLIPHLWKTFPRNFQDLKLIWEWYSIHRNNAVLEASIPHEVVQTCQPSTKKSTRSITAYLMCLLNSLPVQQVAVGSFFIIGVQDNETRSREKDHRHWQGRDVPPISEPPWSKRTSSHASSLSCTSKFTLYVSGRKPDRW